MKIKSVLARQIFDSRGKPTVEAEVILENGISANSMVPSGASTGEHEACELRDNDKANYGGLGVLKAVNNIKSVIASEIIGQDSENQEKIDNILIDLDGTKNKENLGANAILAVSIAVAKASAKNLSIELFQYLNKFNTSKTGLTVPTPMLNILNGGKHAPDGVDMQEFMIFPGGIADFPSQLKAGAEIIYKLKETLKEKGFITLVGDEGGFAPALKQNKDALEIIILAIEKAGYKPFEEVSITLDPAMSELWDKSSNQYLLKSENLKLNADEMKNYWKNLINNYPIVSIEDAFDENQWDQWQDFTNNYNDKNIQLVGDDLLVTNVERLKKAIELKACNSILIKPNQIGTLTETFATMNYAHQNGFSTVVSHRSGETEDTFIADLAVAFNSGQIKTGSLCRSERVAKYNRLLKIYELLQA